MTEQESTQDGENVRIGAPPSVSIVMPAYNISPFLFQALDSIRKYTTYRNYELIVIHAHGSFAENCNRGIAMAKGKYVCLFNDDCIATWSWLEPLVEIMEIDEQVRQSNPPVCPSENLAGVSPRMVFPDGRCQFGGMIFHKTFEAGHYGWGWRGDDPRLLVPRTHQATTFGCVLLRKALFDGVGMLDEEYKIGGLEDIDWCLRAGLKGYKFGYVPMSLVGHHESQTFNNMDRTLHRQSFLDNMQRYHEKWDPLWKAGKFEVDDVKYEGAI